MVLRFGVFALDLARRHLCRETTIIHLTPKAIASMRPDPLALGGNDIWAADRVSKNEPFGPPKHLDAPVNSAANDFCPTPIHGSYLLFVSERPGETTCDSGPGRGEIYIVRRNAASGWGQPQNLGCAEDDLDGDIASKLDVTSAIHLAHAATPQQRHHGVAADVTSLQFRHQGRQHIGTLY